VLEAHAPFKEPPDVSSEKKEEMSLRYLDRRTIERYLKRGQIDEKDYARYLKSLQDLSESANSVETEFSSDGELGPTR
jgi:hypothetical protein